MTLHIDSTQHLFTCELDGQELKTMDDCLAKLKRLDAKGRLWPQDMIMEVQRGYVLLSDIETKVSSWQPLFSRGSFPLDFGSWLQGFFLFTKYFERGVKTSFVKNMISKCFTEISLLIWIKVAEPISWRAPVNKKQKQICAMESCFSSRETFSK